MYVLKIHTHDITQLKTKLTIRITKKKKKKTINELKKKNCLKTNKHKWKETENHDSTGSLR